MTINPLTGLEEVQPKIVQPTATTTTQPVVGSSVPQNTGVDPSLTNEAKTWQTLTPDQKTGANALANTYKSQ